MTGSDQARNPISATVPFDEDGLHHGHLILPWSRDESAWGTMRIPICVAKNGDGPTALITGGNHGDEYEGPLAIVDWAHSVDLEHVQGRVIAVPFMNYPAFKAARRTSPLDGGNMNRIFPGNPKGTVSEKIADYFQNTLLPMAEFVLDYHSGGKTLDFIPLAASHVLDDKAQELRCAAARDAFGAPYCLSMREIDSAGMYDDAAEAMGKTFVTTELRGGGTNTPESVSIARRGLRNFLIHAGILRGKLEPVVSQHLAQPDGDCFHFAEEAGLVEIVAELGAQIGAGTLLARIWVQGATGRQPQEIRAQRDGILIAKHFPGLIQEGDCLAVLAVAVDG
ncbi:MAG: N(2)-acetyl-L-2,4-diaminobutanoate deacetylase DoeB [Pseudomonadota bacterium]